MKQYVCGICGYIHDEAVGGKWEDLPADWKCPVCKADSNPKKKKQRPRRSLKSPMWTMKKWRKRKWKNGNAQSAVTFTKAL